MPTPSKTGPAWTVVSPLPEVEMADRPKGAGLLLSPATTPLPLGPLPSNMSPAKPPFREEELPLYDPLNEAFSDT